VVARHVYTYVNPPRDRDLDAACLVLATDGVIALPTETSWCFVCDADSPKGLERIRRLKPTHPKERPFSLMCASISAASDVVNIDNNVYPLLKRALPGAFTVILQRNRSLPRLIHDNRREVGIRIPGAPLVRALLDRYGRVLAAATVPAVPMQVDGMVVEHLPRFGHEVFESCGHALDLILDLGEEVPGVETTIVDCTGGSPELVRTGQGDPQVFTGNAHRW
jgi:tRNA threonylcarbamoyl adenosine modification protein (Sua5/YciO/YrdC/YwlC family)